MKPFTKLMCLGALLMLSAMAHSETNPALVLAHMMKRMYAYPTPVFEYGVSPITGKYDAIGNCAMLRTFFDAPMLMPSHGPSKCEFDHSRFPPDITGTPVEQLVHDNDDAPPIPFIQSIKVSGDEAQIDLLFGAADAPTGKVPDARTNRGRVVFFLKKLPQGWRIANKLSFRRWPLKLDGENSDCRLASIDFQFALEPRTSSDLAWLPPACQTLMGPQLPK